MHGLSFLIMDTQKGRTSRKTIQCVRLEGGALSRILFTTIGRSNFRYGTAMFLPSAQVLVNGES